MARFDRAIDLAAEPVSAGGHDIVALVTSDIGNGPFHIVLQHLPPAQPDILAAGGDWIRLTPTGLRLGAWELSLTTLTSVWDPQPQWERLHIAESAVSELCSMVSSERQQAAQQPPRAMTRAAEQLLRRLVVGLQGTQSNPSGDLQTVEDAAAQLAGLGIGLTPTGDDELAGVMLALWAGHHPDCAALCRTIFQAAAPRTTRLSRAFLRAASQGLADERWHRLLYALGGAPTAGLERTVRQVLAFGATSGLDMLTGFTIGYEAIAGL